MKRSYRPAPRTNLGLYERWLSTIAGSALLVYVMARRSRARLPLAAGAGYLLYRGVSGKDLLYDALDIRRSAFAGLEGICVQRSTTVQRPRAEVYRFWRNLENLPRFMEHLVSVEAGGDDQKTSRWVARGVLGMPISWEAEIHEEKENELIAWRSLPGSQVDHRGAVRFRDAPADRGTELQVTMVYRPPIGSAGVALARLFGEEPRQHIREDLRRFKQILESGETATISGQTSGRTEEVEKERQENRRRRRKDLVQKASEESFPASDAPAWTSGPIG